MVSLLIPDLTFYYNEEYNRWIRTSDPVADLDPPRSTQGYEDPETPLENGLILPPTPISPSPELVAEDDSEIDEILILSKNAKSNGRRRTRRYVNALEEMARQESNSRELETRVSQSIANSGDYAING